jgi:uncharacterized protein YndB with AHSA1/START domain
VTETLIPISNSIVIERPITSVWITLTLRAPNWLGCMRYEAKMGHIFYMQQDPEKAGRDDITGATHCEILALDEPTLFKFSWYMPGTPTTEVSFQLSALDDRRTRVDFIHEGWEKFPADQIKPIRDMLDGGWRSYVLPGLKRSAES